MIFLYQVGDFQVPAVAFQRFEDVQSLNNFSISSPVGPLGLKKPTSLTPTNANLSEGNKASNKGLFLEIVVVNLGGSFKHFFMFHPKNWGKMGSHFDDLRIFRDQKGLRFQPPT